MDGKQMHCVVKKTDGSVEKCHMTAAQAKKHMAALYASESKEIETEQKALEPETAEVNDADHVKMYDEPQAMSYVPYGVTSFAELKAAREADETAHDVSNLAYDFQ